MQKRVGPGPEVVAQAEAVIRIAPEDARRLAGFLGVLVAARLRSVGWYSCRLTTADGRVVKTLYLLPLEAR